MIHAARPKQSGPSDMFAHQVFPNGASAQHRHKSPPIHILYRYFCIAAHRRRDRCGALLDGDAPQGNGEGFNPFLSSPISIEADVIQNRNPKSRGQSKGLSGDYTKTSAKKGAATTQLG